MKCGKLKHKKLPKEYFMNSTLGGGGRRISLRVQRQESDPSHYMVPGFHLATKILSGSAINEWANCAYTIHSHSISSMCQH
jgi:hypothetical protein